MIKLTTLTTDVSNRVPSVREHYGEAKWPCTCILELANCTVRVYGQTIIFDSFMGENLNSMPVLYTCFIPTVFCVFKVGPSITRLR